MAFTRIINFKILLRDLILAENECRFNPYLLLHNAKIHKVINNVKCISIIKNVFIIYF